MGKLKEMFGGSYTLLREIHAALGNILDENWSLRREVEELREYKQKYHDEVQHSIRHNSAMMGGLLALAMEPGVLEAVAKANESTNLRSDE